MAEDVFITNAEGNFFMQTDRAEPFGWMTCTGVGDLDIPVGTREPQDCPDPLNSGKFKIVGFVRGTPGAGTYTLTKPLAATLNELIELDCEFVGRINWVCRGIRQDPLNFEVAVVMMDSGLNRKGLTNPVAQTGDQEARVNTNADVNFALLMPIYNLIMARVDMDNTGDAHGIYFLPKRCEDRCGDARAIGTVGIMGLTGVGAYLYESEVKKTFDGADWEATPTDPYAYGGDTGAVLMSETISGQKYYAFRSQSVVGFPAEVAISTDDGVSWDNYQIGAVNGQTVGGAAWHGADIWVCCTGGYIYKSITSGTQWTTKKGAVAPTNDLNAICFHRNYGYCVGDANVFLYSLDGGETWTAGTGPAAGADLLSVGTNDRGHVFVGTDDARLFRSEDRGDTWTEWLDFGGGSIDWLGFDPNADYVGALIQNTTAPRGWLHVSTDGGATWQRIETTPNNSGLNSGFICDQNNIWVVGNAHGGTTFAAKTSVGVLT